MNDDLLPIEIRPGEFVLIKGIPHDLTDEEARKIAGVVLAMAPSDLRVVKLNAAVERPPLVFDPES